MGTSNMVSFKSSRLSWRTVKFLYKEVQYLDSDGKHITVVVAWKEERIFSGNKITRNKCAFEPLQRKQIYINHIYKTF